MGRKKLHGKGKQYIGTIFVTVEQHQKILCYVEEGKSKNNSGAVRLLINERKSALDQLSDTKVKYSELYDSLAEKAKEVKMLKALVKLLEAQIPVNKTTSSIINDRSPVMRSET